MRAVREKRFEIPFCFCLNDFRLISFGLFMMLNSLTQYVKDSYQELHKVSWPTKNQAVRISAIVLGFSLVTAVFIGFLDYALNLGVTTLIGLTPQ